MSEETITVKVRDRAIEDARWGRSSGPWSPVIREVEISAFCQRPGCGARRGEIQGMNQSEDGAYYFVNVWANPCGHRDMYSAVLAEAAARMTSNA